MSKLVKRLCEGSHPVELVIRPERTMEALRAAVDRRYLHVRFGGTEGGTEVGLNLDDETMKNFTGTGDTAASIRLCGQLILDYVPVRCVADISLSNWAGTGHLEIVSS